VIPGHGKAHEITQKLQIKNSKNFTAASRANTFRNNAAEVVAAHAQLRYTPSFYVAQYFA
jgi:hypothetical protein